MNERERDEILRKQAEVIVQAYAKYVDGEYEVWQGTHRIQASDPHSLTAMVFDRLRTRTDSK